MKFNCNQCKRSCNAWDHHYVFRLFTDTRRLKIMKANNNHLASLPDKIRTDALEELHLQHNLIRHLSVELFIKAHRSVVSFTFILFSFFKILFLNINFTKTVRNKTMITKVLAILCIQHITTNIKTMWFDQLINVSQHPFPVSSCMS